LNLVVVKYNKLAGIGDHIIYALNRLNVRKKNEIIYFDFNNFFYTNYKKKNLWEEFFFQPFHELEEEVKKKISLNDYSVEYNKINKNSLSYTTVNSINNLKNYNKIRSLRKIFKKYIKFKPQILEESNYFIKKNLTKKYLSVHIRGTDKFKIHAKGTDYILKFQSKLVEKIKFTKTKKKFNKIFLATDDYNIHNLMKKNFSNSLIKRKIDIKRNNEGLHKAALFENEKIKNKNCKDALIDAIILSKSEESLLCQSNLSILSILMRNNNNYNFLDADIVYS
jgi:hypothetical protein